MAYLLDKSGIVTVSNQLRAKGNKVIFTHGSFDLFHAGHSYFLNQAKKSGDVLIVGVDSDERIKRYKNTNRPIISQEFRERVLQDLKQIDFIFSIDDLPNNDEEYFFDLYRKINPNIVAFGRNFLFRNQFFSQQEIKFKEIKKIINNAPSTSEIISRIKSQKE